MKHIWTVFILLCCALPGFAQETRQLTAANFRQEMSRVFAQSRQARQAQIITQQATERGDLKNLTEGTDFHNLYLQKNFSARPELFTKTYVAVASASSPQTQEVHKPWQLMILMAIDRPKVLKRVNKYLRIQVQKGNAQHAVFVDMTKKNQPQLYFLFRKSNMQLGEIVWDIDEDINPQELLTTMFRHLKQNASSFYTGLLIHGHGSGWGINYNQQTITMRDLANTLKSENLHIDVAELSSCHMGSFYTAYHLSKSGLVDYLSASANLGYDNKGQSQFQLLRFLNHAPKEAVTKSVKYLPSQFDFEYMAYDYMTEVAMELKSLAGPLHQWITEYAILVSQSKELEKVFTRFLTNSAYAYSEMEKEISAKDRTWRSLKRLVKQEKKYVQDHFDELTAEDVHFTEKKQRFIRASERLLDELDKSVLFQWCYEADEEKIYRTNMPGKCLDGISVDKEQLDQLIQDLKSTWRPIL